MSIKREVFEEFVLKELESAGKKSFTQADVQSILNVSGREASDLIQSYHNAHRNNLKCSFTMRRVGRTRNASWEFMRKPTVAFLVGAKTQAMDDLANSVKRQLEPTMRRIAATGTPTAIKQAMDASMEIGRLIGMMESLAT